ncbi:diacylglycerol kinase family protein [Brevibacterium sp.]|uniref:diacylglycerol/lipid kinase family protein n=1 Tax=Brevibacterium sp. TaxID=1701 RepID=UPI0025C5D24E|nr:diacylglycerol kinase family protein [Brevibacterium sp.]
MTARSGTAAVRVALVVNPIHRRGRRVARALVALCRDHAATVRVHLTSPARPAGRGLLAGAEEPRPDLVAAVGGDGTVREVAGALSREGVCIPLLPVPTGTADLYALNVGIRSAAHAGALLEEFLRAAGEGHGAARRASADRRSGAAGQGSVTGSDGARRVLAAARDCDLGLIRFVRPDGGRTPEIPFLVDAGMGGSAQALLRTPALAKRLLGAGGYAVGAARVLLRPPVQFDIRMPGNLPEAAPRSTHLSAWSVELGGIRSVPGRITVFPHGGPGTGGLALLAVRGEAVPWRWPQVFAAGFRGGYGGSAVLHRESASAAEVRAEHPVPVHVDGEDAGWASAATVRVLPGALAVLAPGSPWR